MIIKSLFGGTHKRRVLDNSSGALKSLLMDQPDSKAYEIPNDAEHLYSHEKLGKIKDLSNNCKNFTDENMVIEKHGHLSDKEINNREADSSHEKENCPNYDYVSASDCTKGVHANNLRPQSSAVSTSRSLVVELGMCEKEVSADGSSGATCRSNENASSTVQNKNACDGNPKDGEISILSSEGTDCMRHISVKSGISSETGPPRNRESSDLLARGIHENWLNSGEDGLKSILHATFRDTQQKTESSSSSNSTHVILPVSSSNRSYQEMSVEAKSSGKNGSDMNGFAYMNFKYNMEGPATGSALVGMAAQITQKAVDNIRARDGKKVPRMITEQSSMTVEKVDISNFCLPKQKSAELPSRHEEELSYEVDDAPGVAEVDDAPGVASKVAREVNHKVGIYREKASGSSSSMEERNGETTHLSSVGSGFPNKSDYTIETRQGIELCNERDNCDISCSYEVVVDADTSIKNKHFLAVIESQQIDPTMMHEANGGCHGQEFSQLTTKPTEMAASNKTSLQSRFDLNEDLRENEVEYPRQLVGETVSFDNAASVSTPVPVVAKSGFRIFLPPMTPLKFEGELGWKGSAATSAFKPPGFLRSSSGRNTSSISDNNCSSKHSQGFTGIDLNIATAEEDFTTELPRKSDTMPSVSPFDKSSAEVDSERAEGLNIDLNCLGENDDDCSQQPSLPVSLSGRSMLDFDLNDNPSLGYTFNDAHWLGEGSQSLRNKAFDNASVSFVGNSREQHLSYMRNSREVDFSYMRPAYWRASSSMQGFSHGHARPMMMAAPNLLQPMEQMHRVVVPLQPKFPQTLPSHNYPPYYNTFYMGPTDSLSSTMYSSGVLPHITDLYGASIMPQILGPGTLPTFPGTSHLMELTYGQSPSATTNIRPRLNVNSGENSAENESRGGITRQFLFPDRNSVMEGEMKSFQGVALSATPMKRREPEGGWDSYQLGYRHRNFMNSN